MTKRPLVVEPILSSDRTRWRLPRVPAPQRAEGARRMPKRILVVEDDAGIARQVRTVLEADGYDVMQADTLGTARLCLAAAALPQLAVLDVMLPDGDGVDFCHEMKATWPALPVLLTSERLSADARADALATGCVALMPKPFDLETLDLVIRIAVGDLPDRRCRPREGAACPACDVMLTATVTPRSRGGSGHARGSTT